MVWWMDLYITIAICPHTALSTVYSIFKGLYKLSTGGVYKIKRKLSVMEDENVHNFELRDRRPVHLRRYRQPQGLYTYSITLDGVPQPDAFNEPAPNPFDWNEIEAAVRKKVRGRVITAFPQFPVPLSPGHVPGAQCPVSLHRSAPECAAFPCQNSQGPHTRGWLP